MAKEQPTKEAKPMGRPKVYEDVTLRLPVAVAQTVLDNPEEAVAFLAQNLRDSLVAAMHGGMNRRFEDAPTPNKSVLAKAEELIAGDRLREYGNTLQNFSQIAMLWQGTLAHKLAPHSAITPEDVALCMVQVKVARLAKSPDHYDSLLDVGGYVGCYEKLQLERRNGGASLLGATVDPRALSSTVANND